MIILRKTKGYAFSLSAMGQACKRWRVSKRFQTAVGHRDTLNRFVLLPFPSSSPGNISCEVRTQYPCVQLSPKPSKRMGSGGIAPHILIPASEGVVTFTWWERAITQAISRWLPTAAARVRARGRLSPSTSVSTVNFHSTDCSTLITYHPGPVQ
jgi:hypothetical protein